MSPITRMFAISLAFAHISIAAPDWENEAVFRINKELPHAVKMPFPDAASAVAKPRLASPWCLMLNGDWKFHWVGHPDQRPQDFYKREFASRLRLPKRQQAARSPRGALITVVRKL